MARSRSWQSHAIPCHIRSTHPSSFALGSRALTPNIYADKRSMSATASGFEINERLRPARCHEYPDHYWIFNFPISTSDLINTRTPLLTTPSILPPRFHWSGIACGSGHLPQSPRRTACYPVVVETDWRTGPRLRRWRTTPQYCRTPR